MQLAPKRNALSQFFFLNSLTLDSILNIWEKKLTLMVDIFWNLRTLKDVVI